MISRVFKRTVFAAVVAAGILAGTAAHATTLDDVYRAVAQGTRVEAADAKAAVDAMRASATAAPALEWATATAASRRRMMQAALVRVRRTAAAEAAWARVIVALLPLLGLLGTVTGMIESFETLSAAGGSDPGGLTGGISAALLTTLAGLVTALPGVFAVHRLERRTDRLADKVRARLRRFMRPSCCRS